jgi:hypothetical protein
LGYERSVRAMLSSWDDLAGKLSADTLHHFFELLSKLGHAGPDGAAEIGAEIGRFLDQVLPHDGSAVRQALEADTDVRRYRGGPAAVTADWPELSSASLRHAEQHDLVAAPTPSAGEVTFWTSRWLLGEAALSEDDVMARGLDPDDPGLLRLDRDDGAQQWPAFQFAATGAPQPLVPVINRILDADDDPWGAADWWLGHNQWLDGVPARLIGRVDDGLLVDAARAVDPGV